MKRLLAALAMTAATTAIAQDDDPYLWLEDIDGGKAMAWDLRGNLDEEIERAILLKQLGPARWQALARPARKLKPGDAIAFDAGLSAT